MSKGDVSQDERRAILEGVRAGKRIDLASVDAGVAFPYVRALMRSDPSFIDAVKAALEGRIEPEAGSTEGPPFADLTPASCGIFVPYSPTAELYLVIAAREGDRLWGACRCAPEDIIKGSWNGFLEWSESWREETGAEVKIARYAHYDRGENGPSVQGMLAKAGVEPVEIRGNLPLGVIERAACAVRADTTGKTGADIGYSLAAWAAYAVIDPAP